MPEGPGGERPGQGTSDRAGRTGPAAGSAPEAGNWSHWALGPEEALNPGGAGCLLVLGQKVGLVGPPRRPTQVPASRDLHFLSCEMGLMVELP